MDILLLAHPSIPVDPDRFVAEWNKGKDSKAIAAAKPAEIVASAYDGGLSILIAILTGVVTGVATDLIVDRIKNALNKSSTEPGVTYEVSEEIRPDGTRIFRTKTTVGS